MNLKSTHPLAACGLMAIPILTAIFLLGALRPARSADPPAQAATEFSPYVTKDGGISLPQDYRETFMHLGAYAVATKGDHPVDELHMVYAKKEDVDAYRKNGNIVYASIEGPSAGRGGRGAPPAEGAPGEEPPPPAMLAE